MQDKGALYARYARADEDHVTFQAHRWDIYGEYGLTENWTLSAKYEDVDFETSDRFDSTGWRATARRKLWTGKHWVTSIEGGLLEGAALGGFRGCESLGVEIGAGAGTSFSFRDRDFYIGGTLQRREHSDNCYHDRFEGVIGFTDADGWTRTFQLWSERGSDDRSDKMEVSLSRAFGPFEPGIGVRREVSGEFEETAIVLSIAVRR